MNGHKPVFKFNDNDNIRLSCTCGIVFYDEIDVDRSTSFQRFGLIAGFMDAATHFDITPAHLLDLSIEAKEAN